MVYVWQKRLYRPSGSAFKLSNPAPLNQIINTAYSKAGKASLRASMALSRPTNELTITVSNFSFTLRLGNDPSLFNKYISRMECYRVPIIYIYQLFPRGAQIALKRFSYIVLEEGFMPEENYFPASQ